MKLVKMELFVFPDSTLEVMEAVGDNNYQSVFDLWDCDELEEIVKWGNYVLVDNETVNSYNLNELGPYSILKHDQILFYNKDIISEKDLETSTIIRLETLEDMGIKIINDQLSKLEFEQVFGSVSYTEFKLMAQDDD